MELMKGGRWSMVGLSRLGRRPERSTHPNRCSLWNGNSDVPGPDLWPEPAFGPAWDMGKPKPLA
jgi:hypothetical protein